MLGGADNPNGELPSYITGADTWPLSTGGAGKLTGCHHGMMCKPCTGVFLRSGTFIYLYANLYSCVMTGLQPLRHFQRIALPAYHPAFFIP